MDFRLLQRIIEQIISAIQNSAVASAKSINQTLTSHTYQSKILNFPKSFDIRKGTVIVGNQKNLEVEVKKVQKAVDSITKYLPQLKKVTVENPTKIPPYPAFPKEMKVNNLSEIPEVDLSNVIAALEVVQDKLSKLKLNPEVKVNVPAPVVNVPQAAAPIVNLEEKDVDLTPVAEAVDLLREYFEKLTAKNPVPVRLTDGKNYYKALDKIERAVSSFRAASPFMTSTGGEDRAVVNRLRELQVTSSDTWGLNHSLKVDDTLTYLGKQSINGVWQIVKVAKDGDLTTMTYATVVNNSDVESYEEAWENKGTLEYGTIYESF